MDTKMAATSLKIWLLDYWNAWSSKEFSLAEHEYMNIQPRSPCYTAKSATDLLQVDYFTGLLQLVNKLQQACQFHQVATSLLKSGLL